MAKAIVMTMKAWYLEKVIRGWEEASEKHKSRPRCETPVKTYICCARAGDDCFWDRISAFYLDQGWCDKVLGECQMSFYEEKNAWGSRVGYVWHLTDIKFYDEPRDISVLGLEHLPWKWCYVDVDENGEVIKGDKK